jgi:hypothetical protein
MLVAFMQATSVQAQPPRSGGFDLTYGIAKGVGGDYIHRPGTLNSLEMFFSTRMDGANTPLLLGLQAFYFAADDGDNVCIPSTVHTGCIRHFPDVGGAGLLVAYEPTLLSTLFLHLNGGLAIAAPTSDGGPTIGFHAAARIGQSIGRHFAIIAGGRIIAIPDMRGESVTLPAITFGLRIR